MTLPSATNQRTISHAVSMRGIGVHSGKTVSVTFHPADADQGIVFRRLVDGSAAVEIEAVSRNVVATDLCTVIGTKDGVTVGTIEHVMAALSALGIDNVVVELDGAEMPIMDGSAAAFVELFDEAGIQEQAALRRYIRIVKPVRVAAGGSWAEFTPHAATRYEIDIDFASPVIGRQSWTGNVDETVFRSALARSRTFGFMRDVEKLWAAGFALGASLDNAVVVGDDDRVINAEGLRFSDEFARHKTLDAVGDLALAGLPFIGAYKSYRGGHKLNAMALKALVSDASAYEIVEADNRGANRLRGARARLVTGGQAAFGPSRL